MKRTFAAAAAAGIALAAAVGTGPASAMTPPDTSDSPDSSTAVGTAVNEADLYDAVLRDLGLTPEEFVAAGQLGKRAAGAAESLSRLPGYVGMRLENGKILVEGSGAALQEGVDGLNEAGPADFVLTTAGTPDEPAPTEEPAPPTTPAPTTTPDEPVPAEEPASPAAPGLVAGDTDRLFQAYVREVGPAGLQAVVHTGSGFVIRVGGVNAPEAAGPEGAASAGIPGGSARSGDSKLTAAEFVAQFANVELDAGAGLMPEEDLLGGQGYIADTWEICSAGFSAFDPAGLPAVLTAGHCAGDGAAEEAVLEDPPFTPAGFLGTFGFSQFGGPGNSRVLDPDVPGSPGNVGTDIAVLESIRAGLDPVPAATTWGSPSEAGPDVKIIGSSSPVVGQPVCRSGRTSAWSCGTIDWVGTFVVPGPTYAADPTDLRAFNGFLSFDVQSSGGDSGGPWLSGNYAVGTHSAGDTPDQDGNVIENFAVAATLDDAMAVLPGYELELFLNRPTVRSPAAGATVKAGQAVTGQVAAAPASAVPAGSQVRITLPGEAPFEVPVDDAGRWSFTAPESGGPLRFTAETVNGFSRSGPAAFHFAPAVIPPPRQATAPAGVPAARGAVSPAGDSAAVVHPPAAHLANTGASGLLPAAALAAGALAVGGVLLALVRRRNR